MSSPTAEVGNVSGKFPGTAFAQLKNLSEWIMDFSKAAARPRRHADLATVAFVSSIMFLISVVTDGSSAALAWTAVAVWTTAGLVMVSRSWRKQVFHPWAIESTDPRWFSARELLPRIQHLDPTMGLATRTAAEATDELARSLNELADLESALKLSVIAADSEGGRSVQKLREAHRLKARRVERLLEAVRLTHAELELRSASAPCGIVDHVDAVNHRIAAERELCIGE
jgi:hypothetical protein